jgi:alkyl hydroperoxide reductase subunit AhpC
MIYVAQRAENHRLLLTQDPLAEAEKLTAIKTLQLSASDRLLNGTAIFYSYPVNFFFVCFLMIAFLL